MTSATAICDQASVRITPIRARTLLMLALALGMLSFVAVDERADQPKKEECGGFTIGVSSIGGCDGIGFKPSRSAVFMGQLHRMAEAIGLPDFP